MIETSVFKMRLPLLLGCVLGLTACQAYWYPEPEFGSSVNTAVVSQIQNPKAPKGLPTSVVGLDGTAAKHTVDSYEKTFERKQLTPASSTGSMLGGTSGMSVQ